MGPGSRACSRCTSIPNRRRPPGFRRKPLLRGRSQGRRRSAKPQNGSTTDIVDCRSRRRDKPQPLCQRRRTRLGHSGEQPRRATDQLTGRREAGASPRRKRCEQGDPERWMSTAPFARFLRDWVLILHRLIRYSRHLRPALTAQVSNLGRARPRRRRALPITDTEDRLIAAAAIIGFKSNPVHG